MQAMLAEKGLEAKEEGNKHSSKAIPISQIHNQTNYTEQQFFKKITGSPLYSGLGLGFPS